MIGERGEVKGEKIEKIEDLEGFCCKHKKKAYELMEDTRVLANSDSEYERNWFKGEAMKDYKNQKNGAKDFAIQAKTEMALCKCKEEVLIDKANLQGELGKTQVVAQKNEKDLQRVNEELFNAKFDLVSAKLNFAELGSKFKELIVESEKWEKKYLISQTKSKEEELEDFVDSNPKAKEIIKKLRVELIKKENSENKGESTDIIEQNIDEIKEQLEVIVGRKKRRTIHEMCQELVTMEIRLKEIQKQSRCRQKNEIEEIERLFFGSNSFVSSENKQSTDVENLVEDSEREREKYIGSITGKSFSSNSEDSPIKQQEEEIFSETNSDFSCVEVVPPKTSLFND